MLGDFLRQYWEDQGWQLVHSVIRDSRERRLFPLGGLEASDATRQYLRLACPEGMYLHQMESLQQYLQRKDVALTTGTASGKSVVFYAAGIEEFAHHPNARILALYPLKALGREQSSRWQQALALAGLSNRRVARLDGDVATRERTEILRSSGVVVATPDIIHSWLLPNIKDTAVWNFLKNLRLVVLDEVHVYTGVFGSNAAFMFRRMEHLMRIASRKPAYVAASATIKDPVGHLRALCGREFVLIDEALDTSGQQELLIHMLRPPASDLLTAVSNLLQELATKTGQRFIAFMDSRKQTELVATIAARSQQRTGADPEEDDMARLDHLQKLDVLPYRAGLEDHDRAVIQDRLSKGTLRGVVSTSALELGLDIPHLDVAVLVGVPQSGTSLRQRMGRVGRQRPGTVLVVNNGDVLSEAVFREPSCILDRPLSEGALYLGNPRIQYIHAMCLARQGGEHDQALQRAGKPLDGPFESAVDWPPGFVDLCSAERSGEVPLDLQCMKMEAGELPHHTYPLRDVETQFTVQHARGPEQELLGSLSHAQMMREAYPGAVYYYTTIPYRVWQVSMRSRTIRVRREKYYTTRPQMLPAFVFPNLSPGNVFSATRRGDLYCLETSLQVRETVCGYKERRGPNEVTVKYPLDPKSNVTFGMDAFSRNYFTTGVLIIHPALSRDGVNTSAIADLLFECLLIDIPFERQDLGHASGRLKVSRGPFPVGTPFVAVFDQTYGSLRLSGRLMEASVMPLIMARACELAADEGMHDCLTEIARCSSLPPEDALSEMIDTAENSTVQDTGGSAIVPVVLPGSTGLDRMRDNEEFRIEGLFYSPREGVCYRGRHPSDTDPTVTVIVPAKNIVAIPGESAIGLYNLETGEIAETGLSA